MKLRNRKLEKALKRRVRGALRRSRDDWREFKRLRRGRHYQVPAWTGRLFFAAVFFPAFAPVFVGPKSLAGIAVFWAIVTAAWMAGRLLTALRASPRSPVLSLLPLSHQQMFDFLWWEFFKSSRYLIFDFALLYGVLGYRLGLGGSAFTSFLFVSLVQWASVLCLAICIVGYTPRRKLYPGAGLLVLGAIILWAFQGSFAAMTEWLGGFGYWIPGTGWILASMGIGHGSGFLKDLWPIFSMSVLLFLAPLTLRRLRQLYIPPEFAPAGESARGMVEVARRRQFDGSEDDPYAHVESAIRTRQFLAGIDWQRAGWMERLVSRWLTPAQRLITEFLSAGWTGWSAWKTPLFVACCALGFVGFALGESGAMIPFVLMWFIAMWFSRGWRGTQLRQVGGMSSSICTVYPIGFQEIARVSIKLNTVRLLLAIPVMAVLVVLAVLVFGLGWREAGVAFLKTLVVGISLIVLQPMFSVSPGTNDTSKFLFALALLIFLLVAAGCGITLFFASPAVCLVASAILLGVSGACLWFYGAAYNHNRFDLQRRPDQGRQIPGQ